MNPQTSFQKIDFRAYPLTADECAEILAYIPRPCRNDWVKIASSLCATVGKENALALMLSHFGDEKPNETEKLIADVSRNPRCATGTLIQFATQHGFPAERWFQERAQQILTSQKNNSKERK